MQSQRLQFTFWFTMSSGYTPLGTFLHKAEADKIRELLEREGLNATVRAAGDDPPGWQQAPGQKGFVVWVQGADPKAAMEIFLRLSKIAFPGNAPYCEVCGVNIATVHTSIIVGGEITTRHLCAACHGEDVFPPRPGQPSGA